MRIRVIRANDQCHQVVGVIGRKVKLVAAGHPAGARSQHLDDGGDRHQRDLVGRIILRSAVLLHHEAALRCGADQTDRLVVEPVEPGVFHRVGVMPVQLELPHIGHSNQRADPGGIGQQKRGCRPVQPVGWPAISITPG